MGYLRYFYLFNYFLTKYTELDSQRKLGTLRASIFRFKSTHESQLNKIGDCRVELITDGMSKLLGTFGITYENDLCVATGTYFEQTCERLIENVLKKDKSVTDQMGPDFKVRFGSDVSHDRRVTQQWIVKGEKSGEPRSATLRWLTEQKFELELPNRQIVVVAR